MVAYAVSQRLPEIGVRLAVGAHPRDVVALVLGEGLRVVVLDAALGVGGALATGRLVQALLFDVSPRDPLVLAASAGLLIAIGMLASGFPA